MFVDSIEYDPKGQRTAITYGNGVVTTYTYDPETFALRRILTERPSDGAVLQDLNYTYDPSGNVTDLRDDVAQDVYFDGNMATPGGTYTYDALYRLVQATGREHAGQNSAPPSEIDVPALLPPDARDGTALRDYTQTFAYDAGGNITSLDHRAGGGTHWTRTYGYATASNRLDSTTIGATTVTYTHDPSGNMTAIAGSGPYDWDGTGRLRHVDLQGGGDAWYGYDASGQRVRKVVFNDTGAIRKERIDLGGYEVYRYSTGAGLQDERQTLHVMDDQRRIALVETLTREGGDAVAAPVPVQRYQFGNLLDSSCLELDAVGAVISYEEYHPYGTSSYRCASAAEVSEKRYRYTGKEKDEETGLYYHGARYYACRLGRWVSADPAGLVDGTCLYRYSRSSPICLSDPSGLLPPDGPALDRFLEVPEPAVREAHPQGTTTEEGEAVSTPRELREFGVVIRHPLIGTDVGVIAADSDNISSRAARFSRQLGFPRAKDDRASPKNAFRHTLWQAFITARYGRDVSKEIADSHEVDPTAISGERNGRLQFATLDQADEAIDLRNNMIGRDLGAGAPGLSMHELAQRVLDVYHENGLWVAAKDDAGKWSSRLERLSDAQYEQAKARLAELDDFGRTPEEHARHLLRLRQDTEGRLTRPGRRW